MLQTAQEQQRRPRSKLPLGAESEKHDVKSNSIYHQIITQIYKSAFYLPIQSL